MAKLLTKTKFLLKSLDNKEEFSDIVNDLIDLMKSDIKIIQSDKFLKAMNQSTKELYIRDLDKDVYEELNKINLEIKEKYEKIHEMIGFKDKKGSISKKSSNIREIYTIFTIRDNKEVYLEQESIGRTVRELRDEIKTLKLINKELGIRKKPQKEEKKEDKVDKEDKTNKDTTNISWI